MGTQEIGKTSPSKKGKYGSEENINQNDKQAIKKGKPLPTLFFGEETDRHGN